VAYYQDWARNDPAGAPRYRTIKGTGTVEEIRERAFNALTSAH
ncbi:MAG: adenylate kinase, partial [Betaproteobacteria bacterium]